MAVAKIWGWRKGIIQRQSGAGGKPRIVWVHVIGWRRVLHSFRVTGITDLLTQGVPLDDVYTPHSLRATTATLLLDAGVDIIKVKGLVGHRHVTTTQIYDKRRRATKEGTSHDVPI